jgi:hypothetical protein
MRNFFISYNSADRHWAEWIAWQLEEAGYTTFLQAWDFRPSEHFVVKMDRAIRESERVIAVLSPSYLNAQFTAAEWASAFTQDPTGSTGVLLPVRVEQCDLKGLFSQIIYVDLVGKDESQARDTLLEGIVRDRVKPLSKPAFPGNVPRSITRHPEFPGERERKILPSIAVAAALFGIALAVLFGVQSLPIWTDPPRPCPQTGQGDYYEAEFAQLYGNAGKDTEHEGFSGAGYVSGYGHGPPGAATTFSVSVPADGQYQIELCYANASRSLKTLSLYLDRQLVKQIRLPHSDRWNEWQTQTESLPLYSGRNTISYTRNAADSGEVNLDFIRVSRQ